MIGIVLSEKCTGENKRFVESYYDGLITVNEGAKRYVLTYNNPIAAHDIIVSLIDNECEIDIVVITDNKTIAVDSKNRDKILTYILKKAL